jgi:hypothetical protein
MCPVNSAVSECLFLAPNKDSCVHKCGCATNVNYRLTASRNSTALIHQSNGLVRPGGQVRRSFDHIRQSWISFAQ